MSNVLAVYGSLRRGYWNHEWSLTDARYLGTDTITGYTMRDNGAFPAIFRELGKLSAVTVELYDVADLDPDIVESVYGMEFGCGYYAANEVTDSGTECVVFVMPSDQLSRFRTPVLTGDWNEFNQEEQ